MKRVKDLVEQDVRVVRSGKDFIDVIYLEGKEQTRVKDKSIRAYAIRMAEEIKTLQCWEDALIS